MSAALYESARRHGLSHEKALDVLAKGKLECWCGSPTPCIGGAQNLIGCAYSVTPEYPHGVWASGRGAA